MGKCSSPKAGGMLRCGAQRLVAGTGSRTSARLDNTIAEEAAQRVGVMAILTAITIIAKPVIQHTLQPETAASHATALFRLPVLFLLLASIGLAVLQRTKAVLPQTLLDLALGFEVAGALVISIVENTMPWPDQPIRGAPGVAAWIALCVLVIPNRPWKSATAAVVSAFMIPFAHLLCAQVVGYPPLPAQRLAMYTIGGLIIAAWTPFLSTRLYRMQKDLSRNEELGSYRLEGLLGKGGMGEVWRASHRMLRRDAAVKLVRPDLLAKAGASALRNMQKRFEQEAQAIASLRSPHTVALYDFGTSDDGSLYYAMELLDGMDTETLVNKHGPQPAGRVISMLLQACDSLEEAHSAGMVHRDVKPTNLFVCRVGRQVDFVKVLDFGLVKAAISPGQAQLTMAGETSGTPAFMSPEQVRGDEGIDARADIYGLGCVAYFLLTGALVFDERTAMATAIAHVEQNPVPPSQRSELPIPAALERIVMACLEKDPDRRPRSVCELARMLESCAGVPRWTRADASEWWSLHQPAVAAGARG